MNPPRPEDQIHIEPPKFPVYIPLVPGQVPVALLALQQEGLEVVSREVPGDQDYGSLVGDAWEQGGFVLVEHDIVPWWGACRELWECEEEWCVFPYAQGTAEHLPPHPDPALGFSKFSNSLVVRYPQLGNEIRSSSWPQVQEVLLSHLWNQEHQWHVHWPPVAHVRQHTL